MSAVLLALSMLVLSAGSGPAAAGSRTSAGSRAPGYRIGAEDVVQISVWKNESMSRTAPVRPDGKISLPLLNDVQAAGLTPMELREELTRRLAEYMPHPEVSVSVTDVRSFKVSVIGEVPRPNRYELKSWATVMDVLAMAGGLKEFAARSRIVVIRSEDGRTERIPFDYEKVRSGDSTQANFYVRPGDIVFVP